MLVASLSSSSVSCHGNVYIVLSSTYTVSLSWATCAVEILWSNIIAKIHWYRFNGAVFFGYVLTFAGDQCHLEGGLNHSPFGGHCPPYLYELCRCHSHLTDSMTRVTKLSFSPTVRMQVKYGFPCLWESRPLCLNSQLCTHWRDWATSLVVMLVLTNGAGL